MKRIILLLSVFILLFVSCSNNVYIDESIDKPKKDIWRVGSKYFETANEAIDYIKNNSSRSVTKTDDEERTIYLTRDVLAEGSDGITGESCKDYVEDKKYRGNITVPEDFTGDLCIDFGGFRYDFASSNVAFFVIDGGDNVYIYNGTSVIFKDANVEPYAISVDTDIVTIDEHLIDDRRVRNKLISISENGHFRINNVNPEEGENTLSGEISLITDGKTGAIFEIEDSTVILTDIYTKYKNSDGTLSDTIDIEIPLSARSVINIYSGDVTIKAINQKTDYYNSSTTSIFDKAVLNTLGTKENTTVRSAHDIHDTVDKAVVESGDKAEHVIYHNMTHHPRVEASCIADGNREYWTCDGTECLSRYYTKEDGSAYTENYDKDIKLLCNPTAHSLEHIEAKEATCTENGNIEYWHCTLCKKYFSSEDATDEITEDSTVIPHHVVKEEWEYDIDNHWHVCTVDSKKVDVEDHTWGEWEEFKSGDKVVHHYTECSVCGARKVASEPDYLVYKIGIVELELKDLDKVPCGFFYINGEEVNSGDTIYVEAPEVTVVYKPALGSNIDYNVTSSLYNNGERKLSGVKDSDGYYTVTAKLSNKTKHILGIQLYTGGGNLAFECNLYLKN